MTRWVYAGCAVALTVFLCRWMETGRQLTEAQKGAATKAIREEADKTREWLRANALPVLTDAVQRADTRVEDLTKRGDARVKEATGVILELGRRADKLLTQTERDANARLQEVTALRGDVKPVLDELAKTVAAPREGFVNAGLIARSVRVALDANMDPTKPTSWPSRVTGIMGSANTLAGESALTARSWRKATPELATSVAGTASNVKEMTKPRRWIWKVVPVAGAVIGGVIAAKR